MIGCLILPKTRPKAPGRGRFFSWKIIRSSGKAWPRSSTAPGTWWCAARRRPRKEAFRLIPEVKPELGIVDLSLGEESGLDFIKDLKLRHPDLPVLALSIHEESFYAERVLRAGAKGYLMKKEPVSTLRAAALQVLAGEIYLSPRMSQRLLATLAKGGKADAGSLEDRLSDRELDVFKLIGQGRGATDIAKQLHLSIKTIETYQVRLKKKLGLGTAQELFQHALHWVTRKDAL